MKRLILRLTVAILAFGLGVLVDQVFIPRKPVELPKPQLAERCDPSRIEVRTVFVPPSAPPPVSIFDFDVDFVPPSGVYTIAGKVPKDFDEFSLMELWWDRETDDGSVAGSAQIEASANGRQNRQRTILTLLTKRRFLLITRSESNNNFGYRFDGEFVQANNLEALAGTGKAVIRGTLTKTRNGSKVAERLVSFLLEEHYGC